MATRANKSKSKKLSPNDATPYVHDQKQPARPDVGTQAQFRRREQPAKYRYDSSLSPALEWDAQNPAREVGESRIAALQQSIERLRALLTTLQASDPDMAGRLRDEISAAERSLQQLKALSRPFLNWAGKAERLSFDVPTLPLFVHERLSTRAILETLRGHRADKQIGLFELFNDPQRPIHQQLNAYEYEDQWVNRMILGDSLIVMNSLLHLEGKGGQVQMIYMDPPYGVRFGSNFQPFVRKRDVKSGDDDDMTREPEMVQAYRDTWELGLHSYLTYLRDRLLLARELLHPSGSIFVQISDENLHHVREVMDEVFGAQNLAAVIPFQRTSGASSPDAKVDVIGSVADYLIWYARDLPRLKYRQLFVDSSEAKAFEQSFGWVEEASGSRRRLSSEERDGLRQVHGKRYALADLTSQNDNQMYEVEFGGARYKPTTRGWRTTEAGLQRLLAARRIEAIGSSLRFVQYVEDFPVVRLQGLWADTGIAGFASDKVYAVQTNAKVVQRCMLMTTDPGDLVFDPTCGSGTTAYVAEQWGRRWITCDTSRVPLALARQRLLTATFDWYELKDPLRGPAGGFFYKRKQNSKGEEVGGILPHVTLKSIANNEPPKEEILVDRPEKDPNVTRISGPFVVEGTIPPPADTSDDTAQPNEAQDATDRMLEVLRASPLLRLLGNKAVQLKSIRRPAKTLSLSAEAVVANGTDNPVAFVFGPETAAIAEKTVFEAAREAYAKSYSHLYVIGFAIQPQARSMVEQCEALVGIPATYVQATPDLMMGDLLKNLRSSQIFSVCGLPEVRLRKTAKPKDAPAGDGRRWHEVQLVGLDVFDPVTMKTESRKGEDVPAWFLDTDYNDLSFHVTQAFFPRTQAWDALKRAMKAEYDESVWAHLAGTTSVPFPAGERGQIAVKVIDDRGNELMVVKKLSEAK